MPTAIPVAPLTSRLGSAEGRTLGSVERVVEVGAEVDRVLVEVGQDIEGRQRQAGLGVAHGGRRIAVHGAEVALPVDQHGAHGEVLRHAGHGFVDRGIAMRVILTQHLADDTRGFLVGRVGADAHVVHGIQDAALHGLQAVACIRQGARDDDGHGVVEIRLLHLVIDIDLAYLSSVHEGPIYSAQIADLESAHVRVA